MKHGSPPLEMAHNPANYTCPGQGIKCLCWDIEQARTDDRRPVNVWDRFSVAVTRDGIPVAVKDMQRLHNLFIIRINGKV